jgi:putative SOS response-associated peptidase YedK
MCGRFTQERPTSELAEIFEAEDLAAEDLAGEDLAADGDVAAGRFNIAPTDDAAVVVQREDRRAIRAYRWGLIPHWAESAKVGSRMFNARAETLAASPVFRDAFRRRRCLVPVDSFYEWRREGRIRQPFRVVRADGRPFALAGLWAGWHDPETDEVRRSFTIVTTGPNELMRAIHNRMPVVVPEAAWDRWLDPSLPDPGELQGLLVPAEDGSLEAFEVSRAVNDVRNDGPGLILPIDRVEASTRPEAPEPLELPFEVPPEER